MKNKTSFFENIVIDNGILTQEEIDQNDELFHEIQNNLPNLYNVVNDLIQEATTTHGPITIKFLTKNSQVIDENIKFGASWSKSDKTIFIDNEKSFFTKIEHIAFELCNACNKPLNDMRYTPSFTQKQIKQEAMELEKAEFPSRTRVNKLIYDYLTENRQEIESFLQKTGESYEEELAEAKQNLNYTLEDSIKDNPAHIASYEENLIKINEDDKKMKQQQIDDMKQIEQTIAFTSEKFSIITQLNKIIQQRYDDISEQNYKIVEAEKDIDHSKFVKDFYLKYFSIEAPNSLGLLELEDKIYQHNDEIRKQCKNDVSIQLKNLTSCELTADVIGQCMSQIDAIDFISLAV